VSVELLLSLIDDILDNSKIGRNILNLNYSQFFMKSLFEEIHCIFEIQATGKGLKLDYKMLNK